MFLFYVYTKLQNADIDIENDITPVVANESNVCHVVEPNEKPKNNDETTKSTLKIQTTENTRRSLSPKPPPPIRKTAEKRKSITETTPTISSEPMNSETTFDTILIGKFKMLNQIII